jgi:hypothetical protein
MLTDEVEVLVVSEVKMDEHSELIFRCLQAFIHIDSQIDNTPHSVAEVKLGIATPPKIHQKF